MTPDPEPTPEIAALRAILREIQDWRAESREQMRALRRLLRQTSGDLTTEESP